MAFDRYFLSSIQDFITLNLPNASTAIRRHGLYVLYFLTQIVRYIQPRIRQNPP